MSWKLEFQEKFSANNFVLSDAEDNTSRPLNRGGIADLLLLRTLLAIHQKSHQPSSWEMIDPFVLLAWIGLAVSRNLLQQLITSLSELDLWCRRFILLVKTKEIVSMSYGSSTCSWNHEGEFDLTWYLWSIYTSIPTPRPLTNFSSNHRST